MTFAMKFEGIYTPIITPFNDDQSIDFDGLKAMTDHLIEVGVHGLIVGGSTGEYYAQTNEERVKLMSFMKKAINGRVPLIVGVGATMTDEAVSLAVAAKEAGADCLLVNSPPYAVPTDRENALHALAIDRAANLPIMLYNFPDRTGTMMGREYLDRVGRSHNFCAIKESSGDINRVHMLSRDYPHIQLSIGMDDQALEFFAWGARSWVCAASNCMPEAHIMLYEACAVEGNFDKGRRIMSAMMPLMTVLEQGGKFVQAVKHICRIEGLPCGPVRRPLQEMNKDEKRD